MRRRTLRSHHSRAVDFFSRAIDLDGGGCCGRDRVDSFLVKARPAPCWLLIVCEMGDIKGVDVSGTKDTSQWRGVGCKAWKV